MCTCQHAHYMYSMYFNTRVRSWLFGWMKHLCIGTAMKSHMNRGRPNGERTTERERERERERVIEREMNKWNHCGKNRGKKREIVSGWGSREEGNGGSKEREKEKHMLFISLVNREKCRHNQ